VLTNPLPVPGVSPETDGAWLLILDGVRAMTLGQPLLGGLVLTLLEDIGTFRVLADEVVVVIAGVLFPAVEVTTLESCVPEVLL
jgi:hypothetical protein